MAMKVVDIKTERVFENSPNMYLEKLNIERYNGAWEEARPGIEGSKKVIPLKTYYADEIRGVSDADFLILDKYISNTGKIMFDILVKSDYIITREPIRIYTDDISGHWTSITSIGAPIGKYAILKDGSIQIIDKGIPLCSGLYYGAAKNDIISIIVRGVAKNYLFINPMELFKGTT